MSHCSIVTFAGFLNCLFFLNSEQSQNCGSPRCCHKITSRIFFVTSNILQFAKTWSQLLVGGCETDYTNTFLFSNFFIFCLPFQRDEAKCPSLPHSCTCTQDSIGPQGPPGPSVKTPSSVFVFCNFISSTSCLFSPDKTVFSGVGHVLMMMLKPYFSLLVL